MKETACLSAEDRAAVDEEIAADTGTLAAPVTALSSERSGQPRTGGIRSR
ncbi:hypothetical protein QFZ70_003783 [Arthrobacter sp. V1I9]|nr:hypothetical protein [Arthrobacter sp. V1I9]